jgi:hypothetical protein
MEFLDPRAVADTKTGGRRKKNEIEDSRLRLMPAQKFMKSVAARPMDLSGDRNLVGDTPAQTSPDQKEKNGGENPGAGTAEPKMVVNEDKHELRL